MSLPRTSPGLAGPPPVLDGTGVLLTPWEPESDVGDVLAMARDPQTHAWTSMRSLRTEQDALAWMDRRTSEPDRVEWAVREPGGRVLLARVNLHRFVGEPPSAEIGYAVHPDHRRRGVATRAVAAATSYAVGVLGLTRVVLLHARANTASCLVAQAAGFAYEGCERAALDHGDGTAVDQHRHARLADDPPGRADPPGGRVRVVEPAEIAAGRLHLRPTSLADDTADLAALLTDPEVRRWNPGSGDTSSGGLRRWCESAAAWSDGGHATFTVLDATTGRLQAVVSLHRIDALSRDAEIGYRVAPWARGRGVATDAVAAVTRWAFGALGLLRVEARHALGNPASCRILDKVGFSLEGTLRQAYTYGDGARHDEHLHARLAGDAAPSPS